MILKMGDDIPLGGGGIIRLKPGTYKYPLNLKIHDGILIVSDRDGPCEAVIWPGEDIQKAIDIISFTNQMPTD